MQVLRQREAFESHTIYSVAASDRSEWPVDGRKALTLDSPTQLHLSGSEYFPSSPRH